MSHPGRSAPKVPPQFAELLWAKRIGGVAGDDFPSAGGDAAVAGSGAVRIPLDRWVHLTNWATVIWDVSGTAQPIAAPATVAVFRLHLERAGTTSHTPFGQSIVICSANGGADSGMLDLTLQPRDVLIASWRGIANVGSTGYLRLNGTYVLL